MAMDQRVWLPCLLVLLFSVLVQCESSNTDADSKLIKKILKRYQRDISNEITCGSNITVPTLGGSVTSPRWPKSYPSDSQCVWNLTTSQARNIVINFTSLNIEDHPDCEFDYLDVYTGPNYDVRIRRLCGTVKNFILPTNTTQVQIRFTSDSTYEEKGFEINYFLEQRQDNDDCPSEVKKNEGSITSPGWPKNYPSSQDCWTLIRVDPDKKIFLNFEEISLEASDNCDYDYVEVFDGPTEDSPKLGRYCKQSESPLLASTSNTVMVHFHSDSLLNERGYKANFTTTGFLNNQGHIGDCRWERGYRNGTITSPGYPEKYPSNALCRIQLQAPEDYVIKVSFQRLNLEDDTQCGFDYVELREGDQMENTPFAKICGTNSSVPTFRSSSNKMLVSFHSDGFFELEGFLMTYSFHENINKVLRRPPPDATSNSVSNPLGAFATLPPNATVERGKVHVLSCIPKNPVARIRWFKDGDFIGGTNIPKGLTLVTNSTLKIEQMSPSLVGIYKCVIVLPDFQATATAWISMLFNATECPIVFRSVPYDVALTENEFKLLECSGSATSSNDSVEIVWEKNGSPLVLDRRVQQLNSGYLAINRALPGDEGIYTCVATSIKGKCEKRASSKVEVIRKQNIEEICGMPKVDVDTDDFAGLEQGKIVGGTTAERGTHPWQVMIWEPQNKAFCGGALLNERWMMTAAHCFLATKIQWDRVQIRLGKLDQSESEPGEFTTSIETVVRHPNFEGKDSFDNDIALVKLKNHVKFSNYILPVCLGETKFVEDTFFRGTRLGTVAGWGKLAERGSTPRLMKEVKIPTVDWTTCKTTLTSTKITRNMFCAGYAQEVVADSCSGDSGGPFVVHDKGRHYAVGIVSWGEGCARQGQYGFYTKVNNYHSWIKGIIET